MSKVIEVENLGKRWDHEDWALRGVSAVFAPGTITALVGRNGSGKSTLLHMLCGLLTPDEGVISLKNQKTSLLFQQDALWPHLNALRQITLPLRQVLGLSEMDALAQAHDLLTELHVDHLSHKFPDQLSGGERQRVALARALTVTPQIICLDEVSNSLDPAACRECYQLLVSLRDKGKTLIASTHDLPFVSRYADQVIYLLDGEIVSKGKPKHVFESDLEFFSLGR